MAEASLVHRINLRPGDGDSKDQECHQINSRSSADPEVKRQRSSGDPCTCCPYGYHIDLDFVQYAAEEAKNAGQQQHQRHDSLKLFKGRKPKIDQPQTAQTGQSTGKYASEEARRRRDNDEGKKAAQTTANDGTKLANQFPFSDSLEHVMSDFEETFSRGGAKSNKDYCSDYEMSKKDNWYGQKRDPGNVMDPYKPEPSLKPSRVDGYASDCGYAVPGAALNRPNTLQFVGKPATYREGTNHYYASPNTLASTSGTPSTTEYAAGESKPARLHTSAVSGSASSLSSSSSAQNLNGGISTNAPMSLDVGATANSTYSGEFNNYSTISPLDHSSRPLGMSSLSSPRLVASTPLPPKPSLGLSGRIGAQIEQLASHLNPGLPPQHHGTRNHQYYGNKAAELSPKTRLLELDNNLRSAPGPAEFKGDNNRRLQDELNRLINDGKRLGYRRAITPTILDTGGDGYATALAKAMSTVAASSERQRHIPEPPPRRESVTRIGGINSMSTPGSPALQPRNRTCSISGSNNTDPFRSSSSYYRTNPGNSLTSSTSTTLRPLGRSSSTGRREQADSVSDSEYALGDRSMERMASLRRSRHLLSRPPTTLPPPAPAPAPVTTEHRDPKSFNGSHRLLVNTWRKELEERTANTQGKENNVAVNKTNTEENVEKQQVKMNGAEKREIIGVNDSVQKPMTRTIGVNVELTRPVKVMNASTCTPPLPQPKPCMECDNLRQRLLSLSVKPLTFTRSAATETCTCSTCEHQSRLTFRSVGNGTSAQDTSEYRRDASSTASIKIPCKECEKRSTITRSSFGVNTIASGLFPVDKGANTDFVEVRNRHANTERKEYQSCSMNTERSTSKDASCAVEKHILLANGWYRAITTNTTPPSMVTFGVNTDPVGNENSQDNVAAKKRVEEEKRLEEERRMEKEKRMEEVVPLEMVRKVETREMGTGTDPVEKKPTESCPGPIPIGRRMIDKYVDSTVRTRDVGTRTPPPPPPPLLPLRSSSSQTVDQAKTVVSVGSGECTVELRGCDSCHEQKKLPCGPPTTIQASDDAFECSTIGADGVTESSVGVIQDCTSMKVQRIEQNDSLGPSSVRTTANVTLKSEVGTTFGSSIPTTLGAVSGRPENASPVSASKSIVSQLKESQETERIEENLETTEHVEENQKIEHVEENQKIEHVEENQKTEHGEENQKIEHVEEKTERAGENQKTERIEENQKTELKTQRGIQRIFSPKGSNSSESDSTMWTSQNSAVSDASSGRGLEPTEESIVVCPLDDEEEKSGEELMEENHDDSPSSKQDTARKFDFTNPRTTRAFALSKAAAAKKLLTSDNVQGSGVKNAAPTGKSSQRTTSNFQRNYIQSKSVRVDTKKGDSLAYITDKKQFQQQAKPPVGPAVTRPPKSQTESAQSTGLKGKVVIKKNPPTRKVTPVPICPRQAASQFQSASSSLHRRATSLPGATSNSHSFSTSIKDDEAAAEADDVVGPLPSEMATIRGYRSSSEATACYTNQAVDNCDEEDGPAKKALVGDVVENLPQRLGGNGQKKSNSSGSTEDSSSSSSEAGEETDESFEEGSYDTNGNISTKCDLGAVDGKTKLEKRNDGDAGGKSPQKFEMSPQLREACNVMNAFVLSGQNAPSEQVEWAQKFLQHEWLKTSASKRADPGHVGDFLDILEEFSPQLLQHVVNYCDQNENTALHYSVSRGHFDIVSLLLDTKICNLNKANKAGYTPLMLGSLCPITSDTDSMVVQRLFQMGDVNIKASQHGQTALMLAVSHGNLDTTKLLLEAGAGVNIQDEEGSTALMCAAEHGHKEIVRLLLAHPEIDASLTDNDKSTALSIAVENDHKDIGILIYAHLNYGRSPPSLQTKSAPVWC